MNRHVNANDTVEEVPYENETEKAGKQQKPKQKRLIRLIKIRRPKPPFHVTHQQPETPANGFGLFHFFSHSLTAKSAWSSRLFWKYQSVSSSCFGIFSCKKAPFLNLFETNPPFRRLMGGQQWDRLSSASVMFFFDADHFLHIKA